MTQRQLSSKEEKRILVLHGPNLNLLGDRQPEIYGTQKLTEINSRLIAFSQQNGVLLECFQSNHEGALLDRLHQAVQENVSAMIINPGALAHTSIALRDGLAACKIPFIEVHLSNVYARESFRHHSYCSELAVGVIAGFGPQSYELALASLLSDLEDQ